MLTLPPRASSSTAHPSPTVSELVSRYLGHCHARRLSPRTIRKYSDALEIFRGNNTLPSSVELEAALLISLKGKSSWTARTTWQAWSTFFRWVTRRTGAPDPTIDVPAPKVRTAARRIFTIEEIRRIWDAATSPIDKALILVAMDTGARAGEIAALRVADVGKNYLALNSGLGDMPGCQHCEADRAKRAEGGKSGPRKVPVLESTAELLLSLAKDRYHIWWSEPTGLEARNRTILQLAAGGLGATAIARALPRYGFPEVSESRVRNIVTTRPAVVPEIPLSFDGLKTRWRRLVAAAGLKGPKTGIHTLRHVFATSYLVRGGQLPMLQRILGHKNVETTSIYLHLVVDDLLRDHLRASPALQLGSINRLLKPQDWRRHRGSWGGVKPFVMSRDGRRCVDCGTTENLSLDHVMPRSLGGKNTPGNGAIRCIPCNRAKGASLPA